MFNSSNIKYQTSKLASLAMWLFIAVFMVTIQSAKALPPVEQNSPNFEEVQNVYSETREIEEAYLADERNETAEIVVDAMLMVYKANPDEALGNIADLLNCFDFCHDVTDPWSDERDDCTKQCDSLLAE